MLPHANCLADLCEKIYWSDSSSNMKQEKHGKMGQRSKDEKQNEVQRRRQRKKEKGNYQKDMAAQGITIVSP